MLNWLKKKLWRGLFCGVISFILSLVLSSLSFVKTLEWKTWDLRQRQLAKKEEASRDIVLVMIDQPSLDVYSRQGISWPWPRQMYAACLDFMRVAGAKAVVIDLIMSEPSAYGIEDDELLAEAIKRHGRTFITIGLSRNNSPEEKKNFPGVERFALSLPEKNRAAVVETNSCLLPVPAVLNASHGGGNILFLPDQDAIFRRLPLYFRWHELIIPALPLSVVKDLPGNKMKPFPLDREGKLVLRFFGPPGTYKSYSIASLINSWVQLDAGLEPEVQPGEFKDKIVFIGSNAPGLLDLRPTPMSPVTPGVEIQATAVDNLLNGKAIRSPAVAVSILFILFFSLVNCLSLSLVAKIRWAGLFSLISFLAPAVLTAVAFKMGYWLELIPVHLAVFSGLILTSLLNYSFEGRERRFLKTVFKHYLSPEVIEKIIANPSLLKLGGEEKVVTSFFSDVAGFSSVSEKLPPQVLVRWLNFYLAAMTEIILEEGGTLDKYEGDAIIAFWNAPLDQPDHALRACRAAVRCQQALFKINPELEKIGGRQVRMRIGINSGKAVVGNMGSLKRFDYTAMGDTINLASRLEGAGKYYGVATLISQSTYQEVQAEVVVRPVDVIRVVGKRQPVVIYELLGMKNDFLPAEWEAVKAFWEAWEAYQRRDWQKALSLFASLPSDDLTWLYIRRLEDFMVAPPPADWDGVYELKGK
ncbi:MAG: CHASE2 domain-containing protein [Candidatus Aminicenantales bacterium]